MPKATQPSHQAIYLLHSTQRSLKLSCRCVCFLVHHHFPKDIGSTRQRPFLGAVALAQYLAKSGHTVTAADRVPGPMGFGEAHRSGSARLPPPVSYASHPPWEGRRAGEVAAKCFTRRDFYHNICRRECYTLEKGYAEVVEMSVRSLSVCKAQGTCIRPTGAICTPQRTPAMCGAFSVCHN